MAIMLAVILTVLGETSVHFVIMSFDFMSVIEKYIKKKSGHEFPF